MLTLLSRRLGIQQRYHPRTVARFGNQPDQQRTHPTDGLPLHGNLIF